MSRLILFSIFLIASLSILKIADGTPSCDTIKCAWPTECKEIGVCDSKCGEGERFCKFDSRNPKPGCGCISKYVRNKDGECVRRENCPK